MPLDLLSSVTYIDRDSAKQQYERTLPVTYHYIDIRYSLSPSAEAIHRHRHGHLSACHFSSILPSV